MGVNFGTGPRCFMDLSSTTFFARNSEWNLSRTFLQLLEFVGPSGRNSAGWFLLFF